MRRSALFSALAVLALLPLSAGAGAAAYLQERQVRANHLLAPLRPGRDCA